MQFGDGCSGAAPVVEDAIHAHADLIEPPLDPRNATLKIEIAALSRDRQPLVQRLIVALGVFVELSRHRLFIPMILITKLERIVCTPAPPV